MLIVLPLTWPATECQPKAKRRRACKDCSCGLAQKLEAEDQAKREQADKALNTLKLQADDLAEVDFTVEGKVGSCGNCSLGGMRHLAMLHPAIANCSRRFPMRWMPIHRASCVQTGRGGSPAEQRHSIVEIWA